MKRLGASIDSGQNESLQATTEASSLIPKSKKPKIFRETTPNAALGISPTDNTERNSSARGEMIEKKLEVHLESVNLSIIHGPRDITVSRDNLAPVFPYKDLNKYALEIRIVTLKAGSFDVPILCTLDRVATDVTKTISLNGLQVQVRENLWNALRHLRNEQDDLRIWIDAISINQNDIHERNQQVSRMSAIYGMASEVVVWLGPQRDGSEIALSYIQSNFGERSLKLPLDYSFTPGFETQLKAIEHLLKRDYWQRVRIIQEIFRARKINVHCGHLIFGWASFSRLFSYFDSHLRYTKEEFRLRLQQICSSSAAKLTEHRRATTRNSEELLTTYRYSLSSDPSDKIYSLIGLANSVLTKDVLPNIADEWISVDY